MIGLKKFVLGAITHNFVIYRYVKEIENFEQQRNFLIDMQLNLAPVYVKMQLNIKFHAIPSLDLFACGAAKFVSHRQLFCKNSKIVITGHPKECKSVKNRKF